MEIELGSYYYRIIFNQIELLRNRYSEFVNSENVDLLVREMKKITFNQIKELTADKF